MTTNTNQRLHVAQLCYEWSFNRELNGKPSSSSSRSSGGGSRKIGGRGGDREGDGEDSLMLIDEMTSIVVLNSAIKKRSR